MTDDHGMSTQTATNGRKTGLRNLLIVAALFPPGLALLFFARDWMFATFGTRVGDMRAARVPEPVVRLGLRSRKVQRPWGQGELVADVVVNQH
jgi:hypothetical protein